jgi:hypothetical protein
MLRALNAELMRATRERPEIELSHSVHHTHDPRFGHALFATWVDVRASLAT